MPLDFHKDKQWYFDVQKKVTEEYIIPYLSSHLDFSNSLNVLEVGCAEAGVLSAFLIGGHQCTGIELQPSRIQLAAKFLESEIKAGTAKLINKNIYDIEIEEDFKSKFDLIILKDVIEHIPNQEKAIHKLTSFLAENGKIFFAFPPWHMPFGGHQQIAKSKILQKFPWIHLLPKPIYKRLLNLFDEPKHTVKELLEIKDTGITIGRFEKILKNEKLKIAKNQHWFINPIYKYKFGLTPKKLINPLKKVVYLKNFYTSCYYCLVER